jgi:hypothetical protein
MRKDEPMSSTDTTQTIPEPAAAPAPANAAKGKAGKPAAPKAGPKAPKRVTGREAVRKVLADGKPRKTTEISTAAVKLMRPAPTGRTPEATIGALLYVQAKKDDGFVVRTGTGEFRLRR